MKAQEYVYVAVDDDMDIVVASTHSKIIQHLEDINGGELVSCVVVSRKCIDRFKQTYEACGWKVEWRESTGKEFVVLINRTTIL